MLVNYKSISLKALNGFYALGYLTTDTPYHFEAIKDIGRTTEHFKILGLQWQNLEIKNKRISY